MAANDLETFQIGDKQYVTFRAAINHLHTSSQRMWDLISLGDIPITYIESRLMIEYEFLKGFTMPPPRRGRWG